MRSKFRTPLLLIVLITSVYAPFLGSRFIRTAGDEKVYVSQAIEMERNHHWFVQTLQDEPNYYKGPFHYLFLRVGMLVFGRNPWAVLYMNFFLLLAGAIALAAVVRRRAPHWVGGDVWTGAAFALGTGIYAHTFASQMEIELAALFAVGVWLLDRLIESPEDSANSSAPQKAGWAFWGVVGIIGWIKSPLHSAFLGTSALIFAWTQSKQGEFFKRLKNPKAWLAVLFGVMVCIAGYLPAAFLDYKNFWDAYVIRETLRKSDGSGQDWSVAVVSTFGFYLFPWLLLALVAYAQTIFRFPKLWKNSAARRLFCLGFSVFLPSTAFFIWHIYRFENYNLPVISGVWLCIAAALSLSIWRKAYAWALGITSLIFLILPVALTVLYVHFSPMPPWWPCWLLPLAWAGSLLSAAGFAYFGFWKKVDRPDFLALSSAGLLWVLGALFVVLGEREMIDLKTYLKLAKTQGREVSVGYYNLNHNIWSEWGYLNFWVGHEVHGIHSPEKLKEALDRGETILVTAKENGIQDFKDDIKKNAPTIQLRWIPWKRWRTRGQSESGKPLWQEAWERRDLSLLEVDYFIVEPVR
jgi:4-amino-4-deoxy-L-arabinose transferase-like glycosyltransferase